MTARVGWTASAVGAYVTPAPLRVLPPSVVTDEEEGKVEEGVIFICGGTDEEEEASEGSGAATGAASVMGRSAIVDFCEFSFGFRAVTVDLVSFGGTL